LGRKRPVAAHAAVHNLPRQGQVARSDHAHQERVARRADGGRGAEDPFAARIQARRVGRLPLPRLRK
jgi:hypothetical protein